MLRLKKQSFKNGLWLNDHKEYKLNKCWIYL